MAYSTDLDFEIELTIVFVHNSGITDVLDQIYIERPFWEVEN